MKRLAYLIIAFLVCANTVSAQSVSINGIRYKIQLGEASVDSYQDVDGVVAIPSSIVYNNVEYPVTSISENAFSACMELQELTIPGSVKSISKSAFATCISLTRLTFSDSENALSMTFGATAAERGLFADCPLQYLYVGRDLNYPSSASTGYSPFYKQTGLTEVVIGDEVSTLGNYFLSGAIALKSIKLPAELYRIGNYAFDGCTALESVNLPTELYTIGTGAFRDCKALSGIVSIPANVSSIQKYAFENCTALTGIDMAQGVATIAEGAFKGCAAVTAVTVPASVTTIENGAFAGCTALRSVTFNDSETPLTLATDTCLFADCPVEALYLGRTIEGSFNKAYKSPFYNRTQLASVMIGSKVKMIPDFAFAGCKAITSVSFPSSIDSIGNNAFNGCSGITSLVFQNGGTAVKLGYNNAGKTIRGLFNDCPLTALTIGRDFKYEFKGDSCGYSPFAQIETLKDVVLNDGVSSISPYLLYGDAGVTLISIPETVTSIGTECLAGTGLKSISLPSGITELQTNSLMQFDEIFLSGSTTVPYTETKYFAVIFVPDAVYNTYCQHEEWGAVKHKIITDTYKSQKTVNINANPSQPAIRDALGDENLKLYYNLKLTGTMNGYDIVTLRNKFINLRHLDLSDVRIVANDNGQEYYTGYSLRQNDELGDYAFYDINLESVVLPSTLQRIGVRAFAGNKVLASVTNLKSVRIIDNEAFLGCSSLDGVAFDGVNLAYIGKYAFGNCTALGNVAIETVEDAVIDTCAFMGCTGLKSLHLVGTANIDISSEAFRNCISMTTAFLGKGVRNIDDYAFASCSDLEEVQFGTSLLNIGNGAFMDCVSLKSLMLPTCLLTIGNQAFFNCSTMNEVKLPSSLRTIGDKAFAECNLTSVYTYTIEPVSINQYTFSCWRTATLYFPISSYENYYSSTQWGQFSNTAEFDEPYEYFYLNNDFLLSDMRIDGSPDVTMYSGSGFIVEGSAIQNISELEYNHDGEDGASIIAGEGDDANLMVGSMKVNIGVEENRWYFFCFPFDVLLDSVECTSNYVFYRYNSGKRAQGNTGWVKLDEDRLSTGKGYIFMIDRTGILTIHVDKQYLKFNSSNRNANTQTYSSSNEQDASWNFIGNPFISYYDINDLSSDVNAPVIVWDDQTNSYVAYRPGDEDDYQLKPFESFFVQKANGSSDIEFIAEKRNTMSESRSSTSRHAAERARLGYMVNPERQLVNITIMNADSIKDRARIVYNDKASMNYEIGCDASKFESDALLQIYTVNNNIKYAINERPVGNDDIKLGYQVSKAGTYVLDVPRMDADIAIYDNVMGWEIDFSNGGYSFESKAGTFNDRFVVHRTGGMTRVGDGIEFGGISVQPVDGGISFKTASAQEFKIYHPSGVLASIQNGSGILQLVSGTYIVQVNGRNTKITVK